MPHRLVNPAVWMLFEASGNAQNMYEVLRRSSCDGQLHDTRFVAHIEHGAAQSRSCGWYRLNASSLK